MKFQHAIRSSLHGSHYYFGTDVPYFVEHGGHYLFFDFGGVTQESRAQFATCLGGAIGPIKGRVVLRLVIRHVCDLDPSMDLLLITLLSMSNLGLHFLGNPLIQRYLYRPHFGSNMCHHEYLPLKPWA